MNKLKIDAKDLYNLSVKVDLSNLAGPGHKRESLNGHVDRGKIV